MPGAGYYVVLSMLKVLSVALLGLMPVAAVAQDVDWDSLDEDQIAEVTGSITTDLYHEMGHALIDLMDLPVLGNEEDAADIMSVFLINSLWEDEWAQQVMRASLATWAAIADSRGEGEPDWWDVHGPDKKRIATMACLFYGASPDTRGDFAADLAIPEDRAGSCPEEYAQIEESWGGFFQQLVDAGAGETMVWEEPKEETPLTDAMKEEVDYFNSILTLPSELVVRVAPCGQANAFYDSSDQSVTICSESAQQVIDRL